VHTVTPEAGTFTPCGEGAAREGAARIELQEASKSFAAGRTRVDALGPMSLAVRDGELVVLVGQSGCGKTTLLNLVAGFERPSSGRVSVAGREVDGPGPDRVMIFQEPALFPWLDVLANVAFGLRQRPGSARRDTEADALRAVEMVHLGGFAHTLPHQLSGGMKQRVALARALALRPGVLLCDEPFGSLDALTRERLYAQVQELHAEIGTTMLFVTHNTREAACLADRVVVLSARPARVKREIRVDLPRPRDFYDPRVSELAGEILGELRGESGAESRDGV
jgi:NitT/TauT family transport system ATP-binding protein